MHSPQNPTGKVFTKDELETIAEVCCRRDFLAITDEVWWSFCLSNLRMIGWIRWLSHDVTCSLIVFWCINYNSTFLSFLSHLMVNYFIYFFCWGGGVEECVVLLLITLERWNAQYILRTQSLCCRTGCQHNFWFWVNYYNWIGVMWLWLKQ